MLGPTTHFLEFIGARSRDEDGAIGMLVLGIIIGVILIIWAIVALIIPGD